MSAAPSGIAGAPANMRRRLAAVAVDYLPIAAYLIAITLVTMSGPFQCGSIQRRRWSVQVFWARRQWPRTMCRRNSSRPSGDRSISWSLRTREMSMVPGRK